MEWRSDEMMPENQSGESESGHSLNPIAQNAKDVDRHSEALLKTRVTRPPEASAAAVGAMPLPGRPWGSPAPVAWTELLVSILRFKWTFLTVFILICVPLIAAIWTQMTSHYRARGEVRVRPIIPRLVFRTEDNGLIPLYDSFVNTQVSVIRSPTVLQRALDQEEIRRTQWYANVPKLFLQRLRREDATPMERLRANLSVQPRPRTEIIDVAFEAESAADARLIADAVLKQYMQHLAEKSDATEDTLYRQLVEQHDSLQSQIQGGEAICAGLSKTIGTEIPQELISARRVRMDETEARLRELRIRIAVLESEHATLATGDGNDVASSEAAGTQPRYHADTEWRRLDLGVRNVEQQIAASPYNGGHPEGIRLRQNLNFARDLLRRRQLQLDELWYGQSRNEAVSWIAAADANGMGTEEEPMSLRRQLARAKLEEPLLAADLEKQKAEFATLFEDAQLLDKENNALRSKRELFDVVRQRLDQKIIERNVPGSIDVSTWAFSPSQPEDDRRVVFTAMALFLGFGMAGGVAFVRARMDQAIYAAKDMPQPVQIAFLGHVPLIRTRKPAGRLHRDRADKEQSFLIESVRVVRTALLSRLGDQAGATVLITSSTAGTGKTSFTMILGKYLAAAGRKVLMIDADPHKAVLSESFNLCGMPGFLDSLGCKSVDDGHIFPTETSGLSIMPVGRGNGVAMPEEVANGAFKKCMDQFSRRHGYDIILLDGAPVLPVADATILASQVHGAIMVEREHVSRRENLANALIRVTSTGGRLLGAVFVGSDSKESYRYHYYREETRNRSA